MVDTGLSLPHDRAPPTAIHVSLHTGRGPAMMTAARSAGEPRPQSAGPVGALRLAPPQGGRGVWTDVERRATAPRLTTLVCGGASCVP